MTSALTSCGSVAGRLTSVWSSLEFSSFWTLLASAAGCAFFLNSLPNRWTFSSLLFFTSSFWTTVSGISEITGASACWHSASTTTKLVPVDSVARFKEGGPPFFSTTVSPLTAKQKRRTRYQNVNKMVRPSTKFQSIRLKSAIAKLTDNSFNIQTNTRQKKKVFHL